MSGAKHTPGPWSATRIEAAFGGIEWWITACPNPNMEKDICCLYGDREAANAHLIAAAPDLFAILAVMVEICERSFAPSHAALGMGSAGWVEGRQLRQAVDKANAALADARGTP